MSGPAPCRFGVECRRPDCWFAHPNGRNLEQGGAMAGPPMGMGGMGMGMGMGMGLGMAAPMSGYGYMPPHQQIPIHGVPPMYNGQVQGAPVMSSIIKPHQHQPAGSQENKKQNKQSIPCRFGRACRREGCWFPHPDGRDLDEQPPTTNAHLNGKGVIRAGEVKDALTDDSFDDEDEEDENDFDCPCCHGQPNDCQTPTCKAAGRCACQFGIPNENATDDTWRDEWFPSSRTCVCCEGYIYRCKKQDSGCESGNCFCSLTKNVSDTTTTATSQTTQQ